ncbi:MAG TPA: hypothetical protein VJP80_08550 [Candidatus Saccharimonadales bacterium]|nr:hypothetical protein [Candidatus Saccharimonadales bacterium]
MRKLFEGMDSYVELLPQPLVPRLTTSSLDLAPLSVKFEAWAEKNSEAITASRQAQEKFIAESFALSTLCGSVLQVAYKAVELFSSNKIIPTDLSHIVSKGSTAEPFCCGRRINNVPLGLIIYAGRNQHMHFRKADLRNPSMSVLNLLASNFADQTGSPVQDPAFDQKSPGLVSLAHNITALIGWRSYDAYTKDMRNLLSI